MSFFESVWVKLACQRCGKVEKTIVRFHSYSGRVDAEYELMEVAPQGDGLRRGEVWEGNADRYCEKCNFAWSIAQATAAYDALAELIETGLVTARAKRSSKPLTAAEIKPYAEEYVRQLRKEQCVAATMPYFEELHLSVGDQPVVVGELSIDDDDGWTKFLALIDPLLTARMQNSGWVADGCTWEDFNVSLDDERRILVTDMQGRRLTRDGARLEQ